MGEVALRKMGGTYLVDLYFHLLDITKYALIS